MKLHVPEDRLNALYQDSDDPWGFRTRPYEQERFRETIGALPRAQYCSALEIGCGNGELARHVAPLCRQYTGIDAVETALAAARRALPRGRFVRQFLPATLPEGPHDLILLSEVLYFLDPPALKQLAEQIDRRWPAADILCVSWLGPSGNPLEGSQALSLFTGASAREFSCLRDGPGFRLDLACGAPS